MHWHGDIIGKLPKRQQHKWEHASKWSQTVKIICAILACVKISLYQCIKRMVENRLQYDALWMLHDNEVNFILNGDLINLVRLSQSHFHFANDIKWWHFASKEVIYINREIPFTPMMYNSQVASSKWYMKGKNRLMIDSVPNHNFICVIQILMSSFNEFIIF